MDIQNKKKELEERFLEINKKAAELRKQLGNLEIEAIKIQGQFQLLEELDKPK